MFNPNIYRAYNSDHEDDDNEDINENQETASRNNQTRHNRHSPHQIQKLEDYFRENQFPSKEQRSELADQLGLTPSQIKSWFLNKRFRNKTQQVHQEGIQLRSERDMLRAEHQFLLEAASRALCPACGIHPTVNREMCPEERRLLYENSQLVEGIAILEARRAQAMGQGNKTILKLAERMERSFFASMKRSEDSCKGKAIKMMTRESFSDPHRTVIFASTSFSVSVPHTTMFNSLIDEKNRVKWDIFNGRIGQNIAHIENGRHRVSLFQSVNNNQREMRILQVSSIDPMFLIYSPVNARAMDNPINGGDFDNVHLFPSGFAINPDGTGGGEGGCLIKLAFQGMLHVDPLDKVAAAVNAEHLIRAAVEKIKALFAH